MNRDEIQNKAVDLLISQSNPKLRSGLEISMGVGKTLICLKYIDHIGNQFTDLFFKVLVVAPKVSIHKSWDEELEKHGYQHLKDKITYTTYLSLHKRDLNDYTIIVLDECHNLLEKHDAPLSKYRNSIIGVTGTAPKIASSEKGRMVSKYCPILLSYSVDEAVNEGILNNYTIYVHLLSLETRKNLMKKGRHGTYMTSELEDYNYRTNLVDNSTLGKDAQIKRIMRMKALMSYPSKELYAKNLFNYIKDKVILFANTKDQASSLCQYSYYSGNKLSEKNLEMFKSGQINKLSCVLQLSEGVNIPGLKQGIIMHSYGNERKSSQRLGRMLRLQNDDIGKIHILCYRDTIDEKWVKNAISDYDQSKIFWISKK